MPFKVACTSGPIFKKIMKRYTHIFCTYNLLSDWSNAQIIIKIGLILF